MTMMPPASESTTATPSHTRWVRMLVPFSLFALVAAGRFVFVSLYAESVPYWDQWDAEGRNLIKPWVEGQFGFTQLFAPHNEHRIVLTRLVSLGLFTANDGQWDNLVGAYANVFIYAAIPLLLFASLAPGLRTNCSKVVLFVALIVIGWLPYGWENSRVGFQNQFYFMSLFAIVSIWIAAAARDGAALPTKLLPSAVLGIFSMASGLLGAATAGGVLAIRIVLNKVGPVSAGITFLLLVAISSVAYAMVPHLPQHDVFKAHDVTDWLAHFLSNLGWPFSSGRLAWTVVWLPSALLAWRVMRRRDANTQELVALGLAAWTVLQIAGIAYSRGSLSSRYLDILTVGVIANLWMALHLAEQSSFNVRRAWQALPLPITMFACVIGFVRSTPEDLRAAAAQQKLSTLQTVNVRNFVSSGDRTWLDNKPSQQIPYPSSDALVSYLLDPVLDSALPTSVRKPLFLSFPTGVQGLQADSAVPGMSYVTCPDRHAVDCADSTGEWQSSSLISRFPYLQIPVSVEGQTGKLSFASVSSSSRSVAEVPDGAAYGERLAMRAPVSTSFSLQAVDASSEASLLFRAPVEVGHLSALAMRLQDRIRLAFGHPTSEELQRGRVFVESTIAAPEGTPLALQSQNLVEVEWNAPRSGQVIAASVFLGNYDNQSDGMLAIQICAGSRCQSAKRKLDESSDNQHFEVSLPRQFGLNANEPIRVRIWSYGATRPAAVWSYASAPNSARLVHFGQLPASQLTGRALKLGLIFRGE